MAISSALKKTTLLLLLTTLTISLGTALQWERPDEDAHINDEFELAVTGSNGLSDVELYYDEGDGWESAGSMSESSSTSGTYLKTGVDSDIGSYQDLELKANTSSGGDPTGDRRITLDAGGPQIEYSGDSEFVQKDPTVVFEVSDEYSEVTGAEISVDSGDGDVSVDGDDEEDPNCDADDTCDVEFDIDTEDLEDGDEIDVTITADDEAGNIGKQGETFTIDSEWDGDSSADVEWSESGSNVLTGFEDEDQDVDISFEPDSISDTSLTCEAEGDEVDSDSVDASDDEESASCEFDHDDYSGSVFDLTVEAEDGAGNAQTLVDENQMVWDTQKPSISELSQPEGVSTFNTNFDLSLTATDDASGIELAEYYFDDSTDKGDGTEINIDDSGSTAVESSFTVDPGDLGQGEQTVYVRVADGTGQTDVQSFDFDYFPDRNPSINLNAPESVEVTSDETETFSLTIENGAPFFINGVEVQSDSAVWNGTVTATSLEEGDSVEKTVTVDASNIDVGTYDLTLETVDLSNSMTVEVVVRATEKQKSSIENDIQEWQDLSSELEENVSSIGTVDKSNENISKFLSKINSVQTAVDDGRYYEAKNHLESIDSEYESAQATYSEAKEEHEKKMRTRMFMLAIFGVLIIGGGGTGLLLYSRNSEELPEFIPDDLDVELPEEVPEFIPDDLDVELPEEVPELGVVDKIKELIQDAEDEVEEETGYSFNGFD